MPLQTDVLMTVFGVNGLPALLAAFEADGAAQMRLQSIEKKGNAGRAGNSQSIGVLTSLMGAEGAEALALAGTMAGPLLAGYTVLIGALAETISQYAALGKEIQDVQGITGASIRESAGAVEVFRAAGMKNTAVMQELLHLSKDLTTAQGQMGLGQIGITPQSGENGIHLLNRVLSALRQMPDSLKKTSIETELFGTRGAAAIQPLLRMTQAQAEAAAALGDSFSPQGLAQVQQFQVSLNLLGETFMARIAIPLVQQILPALQSGVDAITQLINVVSRLNTALAGLPMAALVFTTIGSGITAAVVAVRLLTNELLVVEGVINRLGTAFQYILAFGGVFGDAAAVGLHNRALSAPEAGNNSALNANTAAMIQNTAFLSKLNDSWQKDNRGGIPRGLQRGDIAEIQRQQRLQSFG